MSDGSVRNLGDAAPASRSRGASIPGRRGPRVGGVDTRAAIVKAARRQFAEVGYQRATLRNVAEEAGVHTRLVTHYFGSKQRLFMHVVELPFDPSTVFDDILCEPWNTVGTRFARFFVELMERPETTAVMTSAMRAAATEDFAPGHAFEHVGGRMVAPIAARLPQQNAEARASLAMTQMTGLIFGRFIVRVPALVDLSAEECVRLLAPVFQYSLAGEWPGEGCGDEAAHLLRLPG